MIKSVGVIGLGKVGGSYAAAFSIRGLLKGVYDTDDRAYGNRPRDMVGKDAVNECDLGIICVPTPSKYDGHCDPEHVSSTLEWLDTPYFLIKSTIPPGMTDNLAGIYNKPLCFSPEYLGEGGYFIPYWKYPSPNDPIMHPFFIVGGPKSDTQMIVDFFQQVMGPHVTYMQTNARTAEMVKYMENCFIAMKVTWANVMSDICDASGVDYREARELWALDPRVNKMHTCVFPSRGFGGKCLPKDMKALIAHAGGRGLTTTLLSAIMAENQERFKEEKNDN